MLTEARRPALCCPHVEEEEEEEGVTCTTLRLDCACRLKARVWLGVDSRPPLPSTIIYNSDTDLNVTV